MRIRLLKLLAWSLGLPFAVLDEDSRPDIVVFGRSQKHVRDFLDACAQRWLFDQCEKAVREAADLEDGMPPVMTERVM